MIFLSNKVPFPALTICPKTKFKSSVLNIDSIIGHLRNGTVDSQHSKYWDQIVNTIPLICNAQELREDDHKMMEFIDFDVLSRIKHMSPTFQDFFKSCVVLGRAFDDCGTFFREVFTQIGLCYTFNGLLPNQLYRDNT